MSHLKGRVILVNDNYLNTKWPKVGKTACAKKGHRCPPRRIYGSLGIMMWSPVFYYLFFSSLVGILLRCLWVVGVWFSSQFQLYCISTCDNVVFCFLISFKGIFFTLSAKLVFNIFTRQIFCDNICI